MLEVVGHRAYAAHHPENTLEAFNAAYEAGTPVLETDLQLSRDGVVVVNHDATTGRMWEHDYVVAEQDFSVLRALKHKVNAEERFMSVKELFQWALEHPDCVLMLDIKFDNEKLLLNKVYDAMRDVKDDLAYWRKRIIWGFWTLDWYKYGVETGIVADFKVINITMSLDSAQDFIDYSAGMADPHFKLHGVSLLYVATWTSRFRNRMAPVIAKRGLCVYLWTVNKLEDMRYTVGLPIHGVITDDPVQTAAYARIIGDNTEPGLVPLVPSLLSKEGLRFRAFCLIYDVIDQVLHSHWAHKEWLFGFSVSGVTYKILKAIHFM